MASSSAEQRKASFVSSATALSTPELESAVETLQDMLCESTIQSYDLDDYGTDSLVGLDKTKLKLVSLKKPSQKHKNFVKSQGEICPDRIKCWMFHIGSGAFEIQYAWQQKQISAGTELAQRSVFAFGSALLSAGFPEHSPDFANEIRSGFGKLVKRLNEDCGDVAPWKWDLNKAVQLVCWTSELIGETDDHLHSAVCSILERGDDELESEEDYEEGDEDEEEGEEEEGEEESDEDVEE